ncbi:MAG: O-antigen ligase family protein [Myxococcales bacterium]|nr:O-antigen ligase family protein [Myxococcales bacterium]
MARRTRNKRNKNSPVDPAPETGADAANAAPAKAAPGGKKAARRARAAARAAARAEQPKSQRPVVPTPPAQQADSDLVDDLPAVAVGLICAILPAVVRPGLRDLYQLPKTLTPTTGAAWMLAAIALMALMGRKLRLPKTPMTWPLVGLVISFAIGVATAPTETGGVLSIFAKMDAYRWGAAALIGVGTLATVRTPRQLMYVVGGMLVGGFQVAIYGIAQHHHIDGLLPAEASRWVGINKPGSTFGNRNMAAQAIVSVMPAGYVLVAMALRWWRRGRGSLALAIGASANIILFVLLYYLRLSVTRSAWGGALLGVIVAGSVFAVGRLLGRKNNVESADAAVSESKGRRSAIPLAVGLLLSGALAIVLASSALSDKGFSARFDKGVGDQKRRMGITELVATVGDFDKPHWSMRFMMWASTWEAIKARPTGGGAGNWRVLFPQYVTQRQANDHFSISKQPTRAHNDFLQFWSEFGLQGFVSLMALLLVVAWMSIKTVAIQTPAKMREHEDVAWMALASVTSLAGIVAICGDALLSFPFQLPAPTFLFFVHVGVIGAAWVFATERQAKAAGNDEDGQARPAPFAAPRPVVGPARIALAASAVAAVGFVHWENPRLLDAERGFTQARAKQKRGRPAAGLIEIKKAIALNPDDFQNHFIEALCHNSLRDAPKSVEAIQRSLKLYPNLLNAWVNLAMFARKAGQTDVMEHALKTALTLKPDEVYALNVKSRYLMRKGKHAEAAKLLRPFVDRHKGNRSFLANAERAFKRQKDWLMIAAVHTHQVNNVKARRLRPRQRNYKRLRAADAKRVKTGRLKGWAKVGDSWVRAKRWDKAEPAYALAAALAGYGRSDLKRKYALSLVNNHKWKKATHEVDVTLDLSKSEADPLLDGLEAFRSTLKTDADKKRVDKIMQRVEEWAGDAVKSRRARVALDDDKVIAGFLKKYEVLTAAGKHPEALKWLEKAAGRGKERRADVKRAFAVGLAQGGQWERSLHEAKEAVRIDWHERERIISGVEKLRKMVDKYAKKKLDELIAKVRLL